MKGIQNRIFLLIHIELIVRSVDLRQSDPQRILDKYQPQ